MWIPRRSFLAVLSGLTMLAAAASSVTPTEASFTGAANGSEHVATMTVTAPTGLAAVRDPSVELSWTITAPRVTTTSIYRSITGGAWTRIAQVAAPAATYTDTPGAGTFN